MDKDLTDGESRVAEGSAGEFRDPFDAITGLVKSGQADLAAQVDEIYDSEL